MMKIGWSALALMVVGMASAQTVYSPNRKIGEQGISLSGWGSGTISEEDQVAFEGSHSLRVSTRNYFQGGIVKFDKPVDLAGAFDDKNNLLRFSYLIPDVIKVASGGSGGSTGPSSGASGAGAGAGGAGQGGGAGGRDDDPGLSGGGRRGSGGTPASASTAAVSMKNIRVIFTTSDGKKSEAYVPVSTSMSATKTWGQAALPLVAINGFDKTNKQIVSVAFSGDATATFYVGDVKVVNDTTPISGDMNHKDDFNTGINEEVEFTASGYGGSSVLVYEWDFDAADGIQVDYEGQRVKRRFRKAGTFTITLTVRDKFGGKAPVKKTVKLTINP